MKKNIILILISLLVSLLVAEVLVRIFAPVNFKRDERNILYRHDDLLGWFGQKNIEDSFAKWSAPRKVNVKNNSLGFRDDEFKDDRSKKNIAFIGDSFVWGYDVEKNERFTEVLRTKTNKYDIYNLGVSGYGTDQEFLLLQKYFDKFNPDIVFLNICNDNDFTDNSQNVRYGGYFKPYFENENGQLNLKGVPVPVTNNYKLMDLYKKHNILYRSHIVKNISMILEGKKSIENEMVIVEDPTISILQAMNRFVESKGAKLIITSTGRNDNLESFARSSNVFYIDLSTNLRYKKRGGHWTPKGHEFVAQEILNFLENQNLS